MSLTLGLFLDTWPRWAAGAIAVLTIVLVQDGTNAQSTARAVTVSFSAPPRVVLREPVVVDMTIRNHLDESVDVDLGYDQLGALRIVVTDPNGTTQELPRHGPRGADGISRVPKATLTSAGIYVRQFVLDEWTELDRIGAYRIRFEIDSSFRTENGAVVAASPSQMVDVTVDPANDVRLREACERHAAHATAQLAESRINTGSALKHFTDPAALPCLIRVARATTWQDFSVLHAIGAIGTTGAYDFLLEIVGTAKEHERYAIANDALRRFTWRPN